MIHRYKKIKEKWPETLERAIVNLENFDSIRLGNEIYSMGVPLLKQHGVYLPMIPYRADLGFIPEDNSGCALISFQRYWRGIDKIQAVLLTPEQHLGVEVLRQRGGRYIRDHNANSTPLSTFCKYDSLVGCLRAILSKDITWSGRFEITPDGQVNGFSGRDLTGEGNTFSAKYR